jgi:DNA replication protein DnaC
MAELQDQAIRQHCKALRMPTIGTQFARLADAATRENQSHLGYLEALLAAEMEERESRAITRLLHEAKLPRMKTLDGFEFDRSGVSAVHLRTLAEGDYVTKAEPVLLVGEAGTGKTHLATGLCVAACRQRRRVRFTTATALINELAEAAHANQLIPAARSLDLFHDRRAAGILLISRAAAPPTPRAYQSALRAAGISRALGRWERLDLICIDELGYVPLAETACELMFQVIADRAEKAAVIVTTNLPFSEWSQVIPNPRLCKALIDRLTDQAHIITTGSDSYRFRRTSAQRKAAKS